MTLTIAMTITITTYLDFRGLGAFTLFAFCSVFSVIVFSLFSTVFAFGVFFFKSFSHCLRAPLRSVFSDPLRRTPIKPKLSPSP